MASKQQFLPEKWSKFNSTLHSDLLIECQIKYIVRKKFAGRFRLPPQPNGAMQNRSMLRPGYRSVRFLDTKCTVGILITYCHSICAEKKIGQHWILCFKKSHRQGNVLTEWINVRMLVLYTWPSWPQFIEYNWSDVLLYFDTFDNAVMPCMVKCQR